jgi:release factor glutamine methyltransferase
MKAKALVDGAVRAMKASSSLDHWQRDRERIEAEELLFHALGGRDPEPREEIPTAAARRFGRWVARRMKGEPIPYILGFAEFRGLHLAARPGVFVPRHSTEFLAEQAIRRLRGRRGRPMAVDLATGGGTVALAIANEVRKARVFGTDVSASAVALARRNASRLGLRASFFRGDLFGGLPEAIAGAVDVVTLHPPYVARDELRELPDEIRRFEPVHTLSDRSVDGLGLVGRTIAESPEWLRSGGWLCIEIAPDRARSVVTALRRAGFHEARSTKGGIGVTRVVVGRVP